MKTVQVVFYGNSRSYAYYSDLALLVGDTVVVDSPASGYTCVKVASIDETVESVTFATKPIICKVDDTEYKRKQEQAKQKAVLEAKLKRAVEAAKARVDYDALAKLDPTIATLVEEIKALN